MDFQWLDEFMEKAVINKHNLIIDDLEKIASFKINPTLSVRIRKVGNELYRKKSHNEETLRMILVLYTKSAALAFENSEEQALAYGNRSALLIHLHKYKQCSTNIERAHKITQSEDLKKKNYYYAKKNA